MKKGHIVLIVVASIVAFLLIVPLSLLFGIVFLGEDSGDNVDIEIDSYRLCEDADGEDIIIIKYLLKNNGEEPTALAWEGDFSVYQEGISLSECEYDLPKECDYDSNDQYRDIKGGVEYYAEIAYELEYPEKDVEVEVDDYSLFDNNKKTKVFKIK